VARKAWHRQCSRIRLHALISWPGNARELSNVAERLVLRNRSKVISLGDLTAAMATSTVSGLPDTT